MAHILPETLPQTLPGEVHKTFRSLKSLPDSFFVWHHLAPWKPNSPDFLVLTYTGQALLIKVSCSSAAKASSAAQLLLLDDGQEPLGTLESKILSTFLQSLDIPESMTIETLVVFANIPHRQVQESRLDRSMGEPQWVGREILHTDSGIKWEDFLPTTPIENMWIEKLRQSFTPETVVPSTMTVRSASSRRLEAGLTNYLLDYNQEAAVKSDFEIPVEGKALTQDFRLNIINGVAGSGKTLILLYRLRLLYHYYQTKKFLVLTHNRPLMHDLESRFNHLEGDLPKNIHWYTFNAWCYYLWPKSVGWISPITMQRRELVIREVWQNTLESTSISERMLTSEIDWIKDQIPMTMDEYLVADRRGRGFGLTSEQRQRIWTAFQAYENALYQLGTVDWGDIPRRIWQFVEEKKIKLPVYDFILIDEAQFFAPIWVSLIRKALRPQNSHLFIVADPTQGFLGRGSSWKSLGLEARGHTHYLRRSYRTTREIMQFATMFYRQRLAEEKDDDVLAPDMLNMPNGAFPQMIVLSNIQDEITRVANEVYEFLIQGYPRKHILLLHVNGQGVKSLIQAIDRKVEKNTAMDPKDTYPGEYVRVTTLNAGAGLESPIVFLVGLRELFEKEQSLRLSDEERENLIRDNTRKIYMAATRAGQRLVFTYVGDLPDNLKQIFAAN